MLFALLQVANHLPYQNPYFSFKHVWLQLLPIAPSSSLPAGFKSSPVTVMASHKGGYTWPSSTP